MQRVIVGAPVAERAWILPSWFQAVRANATDQIEIKIVMVYTESSDETWGLVENLADDVLTDPFLKSRETSRIDQHMWSEAEGEYAYMANLRNNLVQHVVQTDADYFFSLDTDILIPPDTIEQLVVHLPRNEAAAAISPLVNLSKSPAFTAWNYMRWSDQTRTTGKRFPPPSNPSFAADILMAAILMDRGCMAARWAAHAQGEDIGWSLKSDEVSAVKRVLKLQCEHVMDQGKFANDGDGPRRSELPLP